MATYEDFMAAIQAGNPVMRQGGEFSGQWVDGVWVPSAGVPLPNAYALPGGGYAMPIAGGGVAGYTPIDGGSVQAQTYDAAGNPVQSWTQEPQDWTRSLLGMAGVAAPFLVPQALAAGGLLGGTAPAAGATAATAPAVAGGGAGTAALGAGGLAANEAIDASLGAAYGGAGVTAPAVAGGVGGALSGVGSALSGAGSLLNNPAAWALGGAALGLAGNGDITSSQTSNTSSNMTGGQTGSQTGSVSGSTTQGIAPWMQGYAQQALGNMSALASGPQTNASLDTTRGLLTNLATQGDPTVNAGAAQQRALISGAMLNANPYIDQVAKNIGSRMGDAYAIGSRAGQMGAASQSGNWDSAGASQALGLKDRAFADALGSTMSNLYFGNYTNERAAQDAAARGSINFGNFASNNAMNLGNFGNADWQRPFMANQYLANTVNPAWGSQGTSNQNSTMNNTLNNWQNTTGQNTVNSTVAGPNAALAGLGGGLAGAGLWRNLFGG